MEFANEVERQQLAVAPMPMVITAFSAGYETHVRNHSDYKVYFEVNGVVIPDQGRGWNLIVIEPGTGNVLTKKVFDTYANCEQALANLVISLDNAPVGAIVALAVKDTGDFDVNSSSGRQFIRALRSCGGIGRTIKFRASYAMIGVKGAPSASAIDQYNSQGFPVLISFTSMGQGSTAASPPSVVPVPSVAAVSSSVAAAVETAPHGPQAQSMDCVVCLSNQKDTMITPCNHLCLCSTCCANISCCPLCRGAVERFVKVYM
jgi:hypothetical protein